MERQERKTLSDVLKAAWKDPTFRQGMAEKHSAAMKERWADPEKRKKLAASREGHGERMRKLWADPEWRSMMEEKRKTQGNNEETKEKLSTALKAKWADPRYKERMIKIRKDQAKVPEEIARKKETAKELWEDPKYRIAQLHSRRNAKMYNAAWKAKVSAACKGRVAWNKGLTKDTDERLMERSKALRGQTPDYNKMRAWYPSEKVKKIRMRSGWEVGYALYLDAKGIEWEYEPRYFHVGKGAWTGVTYIPDFYLPESGWYVEIKGWQGEEWEAKFEAFQKRYSKVKVKVLRMAQLKRKGVVDIHGNAVYRKERR